MTPSSMRACQAAASRMSVKSPMCCDVHSYTCPPGHLYLSAAGRRAAEVQLHDTLGDSHPATPPRQATCLHVHHKPTSTRFPTCYSMHASATGEAWPGAQAAHQACCKVSKLQLALESAPRKRTRRLGRLCLAPTQCLAPARHHSLSTTTAVSHTHTARTCLHIHSGHSTRQGATAPGRLGRGPTSPANPACSPEQPANSLGISGCCCCRRPRPYARPACSFIPAPLQQQALAAQAWTAAGADAQAAAFLAASTAAPGPAEGLMEISAVMFWGCCASWSCLVPRYTCKARQGGGGLPRVSPSWRPRAEVVGRAPRTTRRCGSGLGRDHQEHTGASASGRARQQA